MQDRSFESDFERESRRMLSEKKAVTKKKRSVQNLGIASI
jgi:hypothetical protein